VLPGILAEGEFKTAAGIKFTPPVLLGEGCAIEAGAVIKGPAVIGKNCTIGKNAAVEESILWDEVKLEEGSQSCHCIIAGGCRFCQEAKLENKVAGAELEIEAPFENAEKLLLEAGNLVKLNES